MNIAFLSAVAPVVLLLCFIYRKDKEHPEPTRLLLRAFLLGCFSVLPASLMETALSLFTPAEPVSGALYTGFVVAGFSEEFCKLWLLKLAIWRNRHFDEYFDGIVYAVFLGMGFACVENVMYVLQGDNTMMVATMRGLLAVPAHFLFAVTMGYYLSLAKFDTPHRHTHSVKAFLYPLLLHGTYDALLMVSSAIGGDGTETSEAMVCGVLMMLFLIFDVLMWRRGLRRIRQMQERSKEQNFDPMNPFEGFQWRF